MTSLDPAPTIRDAKWDRTLRLMDYLNKKWAYAMAHGREEVTLKFPTGLVVTITDALRHMIDHRMPLYRLHVDVEEYSRAMVAQAAVAEETMRVIVLRAGEAVADLELLLQRRFKRPVPVAKRHPPVHAYLGFGG